MNKIKIALVFENIETAKEFVAINAPNGVVKINSANIFVYDTPIVDCRGRRANFIYTTEDIRDTKWFDEIIRPMQIVGTEVIETKGLGGTT